MPTERFPNLLYRSQPFGHRHSAKSGHDVKADDEIIIRKANEETVARVLNVPTSHNVSRRDANSLIEIVRRTELDPEKEV